MLKNPAKTSLIWIDSTDRLVFITPRKAKSDKQSKSEVLQKAKKKRDVARNSENLLVGIY